MLRNNRNNINPEYDFNIDDTQFDYLREYPFLDFDESFDLLPDFFPAYELDDGASERKEYFQFGEDPALQRSGSGVLPPQPGTVSASFAGDSYALDGSIEQDSLFSELFESMPVAASSLNGPDSGSPEDFMAAILGDINHVSSPATSNPAPSPLAAYRLSGEETARTAVPDAPRVPDSVPGPERLLDDAAPLPASKKRRKNHDTLKAKVEVDGKAITLDAFCRRNYVFAGTDNPVSSASLRSAQFNPDGTVLVNGRKITWVRRSRTSSHTPKRTHDDFLDQAVDSHKPKSSSSSPAKRRQKVSSGLSFHSSSPAPAPSEPASVEVERPRAAVSPSLYQTGLTLLVSRPAMTDQEREPAIERQNGPGTRLV